MPCPDVAGVLLVVGEVFVGEAAVLVADEAVARDALRIEIGAVRAHAPTELGGVAAEAGVLLVTARALLHALSRGLPVGEQPVGLQIVERVAARRPVVAEAEVGVTVPAEDLGRVAGGAVVADRIRLGCVPHDEVDRMETPGGLR